MCWGRRDPHKVYLGWRQPWRLVNPHEVHPHIRKLSYCNKETPSQRIGLPPPKRQLYNHRSYSQPAAWALPEEQDLRPASPASRAVCFQSRLATETALVVGWDPAEGYHSIVHSRQKEPAERADLRLRVREKGGGGGGGGIFVGGGFIPDLLEGFGEWKGCEKREGIGALFLKEKRKKQRLRAICACEMRRGREGLESQRLDTYVLPDF